jgi:hypothetical protein
MYVESIRLKFNPKNDLDIFRKACILCKDEQQLARYYNTTLQEVREYFIKESQDKDSIIIQELQKATRIQIEILLIAFKDALANDSKFALKALETYIFNSDNHKKMKDYNRNYKMGYKLKSEEIQIKKISSKLQVENFVSKISTVLKLSDMQRVELLEQYGVICNHFASTYNSIATEGGNIENFNAN